MFNYLTQGLTVARNMNILMNELESINSEIDGLDYSIKQLLNELTECETKGDYESFWRINKVYHRLWNRREELYERKDSTLNSLCSIRI